MLMLLGCTYTGNTHVTSGVRSLVCLCGECTTTCTEDADGFCAAVGVDWSTTDDSYRSGSDRDGELTP